MYVAEWAIFLPMTTFGQNNKGTIHENMII